MKSTSGTTVFQPALADLVIEAYSRLQIRGAALLPEHIIEARRTMNFILQEWSGGRGGPPLWAVDQIAVPLLPGVASYPLPSDTINILDAYRRLYQPSTTTTDLGTALTAMTDWNGDPILGNPYGDVATQQPGGILSATAGDLRASLVWPSHGLVVGSPIFWSSAVSIGGVSLGAFSVVSAVLDENEVQFLLPSYALETQPGQGAPPLYQSAASSTAITVFLPNHNLQVGDNFNIGVSITVGGATLAPGAYPIVSVIANPQAASLPSYSFTITAPINASSKATAFENGGQIRVATQQTGIDFVDLIMEGLSRTEYAALPQKMNPGTPTVFWFDRTTKPVLNAWQVSSPGSTYGYVAYRWRQLQDANPVAGEVADLPNRWLPAFTAQLTAGLAEKFRPDLHVQKMMLAKQAFDMAATEDQENVPLYVLPSLDQYYRI